MEQVDPGRGTSFLHRKRYEYHPLNETKDEIRLLHLQPGLSSEDVRVSLEIVQFSTESVLDFEALSYVWGSTWNSGQILIGESSHADGETVEFNTLPVTYNLAEALLYLRLPDRPRTLWIDAICVNQQDLEERSCQVKRMADVYSRARRVLVWLGKDSNDLALECMETLATKIEFNWETEELISLTDEPHWADLMTELPYDVDQWTALAVFFSRSWFGRLWIWQEVCLARSVAVLCGSGSIAWDHVRLMGLCLHSQTLPPWYYDFTARERRETVYLLCALLLPAPILDLIDKTKHSFTTDPRDRIYALSSMSEPKDVKIHPDYTKTATEVYRTFMAEYIKQGNEIDILAMVDHPDRLPASSPSWVPDFSVIRTAIPLVRAYASCWTICSPEFPDDDTIQLPGVIVGTISSIGAYSAPEPSALTVQGMLRVIAQSVHDLQRENEFEWGFSQYHDLCQALYSGVFADTIFPFSENSLRPITKDAEISSDSLLDDTYEGDELKVTLSTQLSPEQALTVSHCSQFLLGRSLFMTEMGRVGLAPTHAETGDLITVLLGCQTPIVIRKVEPGKYRVVGEAFLNGFMNGESLLGPLPDGFRLVHRYNEEEGKHAIVFLHEDSGDCQVEDPRLDGIPLPPGWSNRYPRENSVRNQFANDETGEDLGERDPRLTVEFLLGRGIKMETFTLV